jgi:MFS transporter, DHA2 family, multidrug resistance protein
LISVLAVIYGLKQIVQDGLGWLPVLAIVAGLLVGLAFVRRQTKLVDPLIDLGLFRVRAFSASLAVYTLAILILFGTFLFVFQYLQLVLDKSPLEAALWTMPSFASFIVGSMLAPVIVRYVQPAYVMAAGLMLGAAGFVILAQVDSDSGVGIVVASSLVFSLGMAPLFTLTNDLIIGSAPPEKAGAASGISETGAELGGALSIAVLGVVGAAVYRNEVGDAIPAGVPSEQADAARDTLGGAVAAADELPAAPAAELLEAAREAFVLGMQVAAIGSAVVAAAAAVLAAVLLRGVRGGPAGESAELEPPRAPTPAPALEPE